MSKIGRSDFFDSFAHTRNRQKAHSASRAPHLRFHQTLLNKTKAELAYDQEHASHHAQENIAELIMNIQHISGTLKKKLTWSAVMEYKQTISRILALAKKEIFHIEERVSLHSDGNNKRFFLIQEIDTKINTMVSHFIQKECAQLTILEMVGEINGLLIDLQS